MIEVKCSCGMTYRFADSALGRKARCKCGQTLTVRRLETGSEGRDESDATVKTASATPRVEPKVVYAPSGSKSPTSENESSGSRTGSSGKSSKYGSHTRIRELGRGGMGSVNLALDANLKREVALKELLSPNADNRAVARFIDEAKITASLEHPGVVPIYALGVDDAGRPYYTMKLVQGKTLKDAINDYRALPPKSREAESAFRELIRRFASVCQTMSFAHDRNVIHRDLKPANIMLGQHGETLVMDWGLAKPYLAPNASESRRAEVGKMMDDRLDSTRADRIVGTPAYMSPEQASGRGDARSDIYSLGVILYQILTNRVPFKGKSSRELIEQHSKARPKAPSARVKDRSVPKGLEAICLKALEKDPEDRYQDARSMHDDLIAWLDDEPIAALKDSFFDKAWRWTRKNRALATTILTSILIFLTLTGSFATIVQRGRARAEIERTRAEFERGRAEIERARARELDEKNEKLRATLTVKENELARRKQELADAYDRLARTEDQSSKDREALRSEISRLVGVIAALEPEIANIKEQIEKNSLLQESSPDLEKRVADVEFKREVELEKRLVENAYEDMLRDAETMELSHDVYRDLTKRLEAATDESERSELDQEKARIWSSYSVDWNRFFESYRRLAARRARLVELYENASKPVPDEIAQKYCDRVPVDWNDALESGTTPFNEYEVLYEANIRASVSQKRSVVFNGRETPGVFAYADSAIRATIPEGAERFTAVVGLVDELVERETSEWNELNSRARLFGDWFYEVWFDDRLAYISEELRNYPDRTNYINIPIPRDAKTITLRTFMGENDLFDHSYWRAPAFHGKGIGKTGKQGDARKPGDRKVLTINGVDVAFRWCPPGTFMMGSPEDETGRFNGETQHEVELTRGFWLAETETTQGLWTAVMGNNPSAFKGDDLLPVEQVSWNDCQDFIRKLNDLGIVSDGIFRLPTESEWEYACRAGTTTAFSFGNVCDGSQENCNGNSPYGTDVKGQSLGKTTKVGSYSANPWGLYDMHGNVLEWCADLYGAYPAGKSTDPTGSSSGRIRVLRGGSWYNGAGYCRSANRYFGDLALRLHDYGFRLLLTDSANENALDADAHKIEVEGRDANSTPNASEQESSLKASAPDPPFQAGERRVVKIKSVDVAFRWCPPGTFMMGSPEGEAGRRDDDETLHEVELTRGFWLAETETTQGLWKAVMGNNPSHFKGDDLLPVEEVSWDDCQDFIRKLNDMGIVTDGSFRLPTESEWEYACRAGTTTVFSFGNVCDGSQANCNGNYPYGTDAKGQFLDKTTKVGSYIANPWGLYDMHGNVWEWCADGYGYYPTGKSTDPAGATSGSSRVLRGGSWGIDARSCRSACRFCFVPANRVGNHDFGFRLLLTNSK